MSDIDKRERFNLSRWALEHPGAHALPDGGADGAGLRRLLPAGAGRRPALHLPRHGGAVFWPGATAQQVAEQVTDKIERTLQEVPYSDIIRSYSKPGEALIILQIKDSSRAAEVPNVWYTVRKKIGDMRSRCRPAWSGAVLQRRIRRRLRRDLRAGGRQGYSYAEVKTFADDVRQQLLRVPDVAKVELFGVQDEKLYIEISQKRLSQLGLDLNQVLAQLGQQNAVESAGAVQTPLGRGAGARGRPVRGGRAAARHADPRRSGNQLRLGDIAESSAATSTRRR
jgi:multidrug efflux pump